eukprot:CAMPEP_0169075376 /NCGR_PEP_ID=MMETSP1015-20121227/7789_1 /TAXON_ID=342587 /ORGANISM="Karlodinium micrum, Strain CCMP2283" /LENGTH=326 /DNA_ID=CAMNT_0009134783 /DNA_START=61 /DNA_END=1042 /DNA_ORIENTATION=-
MTHPTDPRQAFAIPDAHPISSCIPSSTASDAQPNASHAPVQADARATLSPVQIASKKDSSLNIILGCICFLMLAILVALVVLIYLVLNFRADMDTINTDYYAKPMYLKAVQSLPWDQLPEPYNHIVPYYMPFVVHFGWPNLADWLNNDILRLDIGKYAKKAYTILPFFEQVVGQLPKASLFNMKQEEIDDAFRHVANWLYALSNFEQVADSYSKPVNGDVPNIIHSTLDRALGDAMDPKQIHQLALACSTFSTNAGDWVDRYSSTLQISDQDREKIKTNLGNLGKVCSAISNVSADEVASSQFMVGVPQQKPPGMLGQQHGMSETV